MNKITKRTLALSVAAAVVAGTGVAFAYWTTSGSGDGSALAKSENGSVVLYATFNSDELAPGADAVDVDFSASNASPTSLYVATLAVDSITTDDVDCDAAWFSVAADSITENTIVPTSTALSPTALPNGTTVSMANSDDNQDACKGATITLHLSSV